MGVLGLAQLEKDLNELGKNLPKLAILPIQKATSQLALRVLVTNTPVDQGRLRGNWQVWLEIESGSEKAPDPSGQATISNGNATISARRQFGIDIISNGLDYARTVDEGGFEPADPVDTPEANERRAAFRRLFGVSESRLADIAALYGDEGAPLVKGGFSKQAPQGMSVLAFEAVKTYLAGIPS